MHAAQYERHLPKPHISCKPGAPQPLQCLSIFGSRVCSPPVRLFPLYGLYLQRLPSGCIIVRCRAPYGAGSWNTTQHYAGYTKINSIFAHYIRLMSRPPLLRNHRGTVQFPLLYVDVVTTNFVQAHARRIFLISDTESATEKCLVDFIAQNLGTRSTPYHDVQAPIPCLHPLHFLRYRMALFWAHDNNTAVPI